MSTSLLAYTPERARDLYRSEVLATSIASLESNIDIEDATRHLWRVVNTSTSRSEPFSRWVRYREAYSPSLVEHLLTRSPVAKDAYILDPMCGSGSTQLAGQRLGLPSIGLDVSPYAVAVSNVKTHALDEGGRSDLARELARLEAPRPHGGSLAEGDAALERYFPERSLRILIAIRSLIQRSFGSRPKVQEFATVALLSILEECSNRKKDGNGLATRPTQVRQPWDAFVERLMHMLDDLDLVPTERTPSATYHMSAVDIGAACKLADQLFKAPLGAVVFSPPYPNSFDYFESYKIELLFGQFYSPKELQAARTNLIRNYRQSGSSIHSGNDLVELLIQEIVSRIPTKEARTGVRDSRSRLLPNLLRGYFEDMHRVLVSAFDAMPSGVEMHIVVDQSAYLGVPIPTDLLLGDIGKRIGFVFDELILCRPARTSPQQAAEQPVLKETLRESVVTLRKP